MVELTSKVNRITEQYLERFGKVRVAIYHLVISQQEPFSSFINSLMIKLRRRDQMPCFIWFSTTVSDSRYLILWSNAYFRNDLSDITPTVFRLGELHGLRTLCEISIMFAPSSAHFVLTFAMIPTASAPITVMIAFELIVFIFCFSFQIQ